MKSLTRLNSSAVTCSQPEEDDKIHRKVALEQRVLLVPLPRIVHTLKRQPAIDINQPIENVILVKKSQSLNDVASNHSEKAANLKPSASCDDKECKTDTKMKKNNKNSDKISSKAFKR